MDTHISNIREHLTVLVGRGECPTAILLVGSTREERDALAQWLIRTLNPSDVIRLAKEDGEYSLSVDDVRDVLSRISRSTLDGGARVIYCAQGELLTASAGNALLKCLEEPPANARFIFSAQSTQCVLPTIVSRCEIVRLPLVLPRSTDGAWRSLLVSPLWRRMAVGDDAASEAVNLDLLEYAVHDGFHSSERREELAGLARIADTVRALRMSKALAGSRFVRDRIALS